ncbi:MAG: protoporphyrinogen/coproporphyrinogen oxidase [Acidimicrobiia bacterium]
MSSSYDVAVLGAGPAGLMAARRLAVSGRSVVVLERAGAVGGMAGSFDVAGVRVDFGSHRLHRVLEPWLEADLMALLGNDLQRRARKGRIALAGRWLAFPLRIGDLARHLPRPLLARIAFDTALGPLRKPGGDDAGSVIAARLGPTVAKTFYTPYLTKLWDTPPEELSTELADRRVSARSGASVVRKALATRKGEGGAQYLYPRRGFGQISDAVADAAVGAGADIRLGATVTGARLHRDRCEVLTQEGGTLTAGSVLSSIPVPLLARLAGAPEPVLEAAGRLRHRAMVLAYLVFATDQLTPFDAHYFPELATPVSRLSEPKNFRAGGEDASGVTVVCAELPCWEGDDTWTATPAELAERVMATLEPFGFVFPALQAAEARHIPRCYPVYTGRYAADLDTVEQWAAGHARLVTFGRQGLFAPDNTHHALAMGGEAAGALLPDGTVDRARWDRARRSFRANVVED